MPAVAKRSSEVTDPDDAASAATTSENGEETLTPAEATRRVPAPETDAKPSDPIAPEPHEPITADVPAIPSIAGEKSALTLRSTKIVPMAPLRGSLESLERQNVKTEDDGLERILNDEDLNDRIARGMLVPVPISSALDVNAELPANRRYCRPWTARFLTDLSRAHAAMFHRPLEVSSAVRTVAYQKRLMEINGNAAQAEGDIASPHLTGATIDIAKHGMTAREIYWMRDRLTTLQNQGKIDVEEEFHQACFHITVYKSYVGAGPLHKPRHRVVQPEAPPPSEPVAASESASGAS